MRKLLACGLGLIIGGLVIAHYKSKSGRLFGKMNVERSLTWARIPIVVSLLRAGFGRSDARTRRALTSTGLSYLGMGGGALIDRRLGGMLQKGFTRADILFHLVSGSIATLAGLPGKRRRHASMAD